MATSEVAQNSRARGPAGLHSEIHLQPRSQESSGSSTIFLALTAVLVGMFLSLFMRIHLIWPDANLPLIGHIAPEAYLSLLTMHGTIMVFFVLTTAPQGGFGNYFLPIQIGAPDMAFPVLNMLSFWTTFVAFVVMLAAFFVTGGAPLHGWTGYPPLSALPVGRTRRRTGRGSVDHQHRDLLRASLMGALNFITTTLDLRAKGMTLMRMPLTCWTWFVTAILGLLAFGVLLSAGILLLLDRNLGTSFFVPVGRQSTARFTAHKGGSPLLWQHLFWFFGHPEVYIAILPGMGVCVAAALDVLAQADFRLQGDGVRDAGHRVPGLHGLGPSHVHERHEPVFGVCLLDADHGDRRAFGHQDLQLAGHALGRASPFLYADAVCHRLCFAVRLGRTERTIPGATGARHPLHDTYFVVGHFHLIMGVAAIFGMFAATYYWFPKMFGRMMNESLGKIHFWITFIGTYAIFMPMHFLGMAGHPRRYSQFTELAYLQPLIPVQTVHDVRCVYHDQRRSSSSSSICSGACLKGRRLPTIPGMRPPWSGRPPRRRRTTISAGIRRSCITVRTNTQFRDAARDFVMQTDPAIGASH